MSLIITIAFLILGYIVFSKVKDWYIDAQDGIYAMDHRVRTRVHNYEKATGLVDHHTDLLEGRCETSLLHNDTKYPLLSHHLVPEMDIEESEVAEGFKRFFTKRRRKK